MRDILGRAGLTVFQNEVGSEIWALAALSDGGFVAGDLTQVHILHPALGGKIKATWLSLNRTLGQERRK